MFKNNLIVYENEWILRRIYQVSDRIRHSLTDQTLFEERCIKRVGDYLLLDFERSKNRRYIERMINEVATSVIRRNRKEESEVFSSVVKEDEGGKEIEFEPIDVLGNVESEVIAKEMTVLLGKDGRRKEILKAWSIGNTNDKLISSTLGRTMGGNVESHRKFIQRFRDECREQLSTAI